MPTQGHNICVICPTSSLTHPLACFLCYICLAFADFFFRPWHGHCCECRVGSLTAALSLFTSFCAVAREGSGAICLIGSFCLRCCDRASVISSHIVQDVRSIHTFHGEDGKSKMEIWPRAGTSGNETSLCPYQQQQWDVQYILKPDPATLSHDPVEILWSLGFYCCSSPFSERSLCFTNHDDFNIFCLNDYTAE